MSDIVDNASLHIDKQQLRYYHRQCKSHTPSRIMYFFMFENVSPFALIV